MSLRWCGEEVENSFGPTVRDCRDGFDFTVFFEQLFLAIVPSAVLVLLVPFRIYKLYRASPKARGGWLLPLKILAATTYTTLQLYLLVRWVASPPFPARAATSAAALSVLAGCAVLALSPLEHLRALRPSTLLQSYLLLSVLFDAALCRTLWMIGRDSAIERVSTAITALKLVLLCLEMVEKRRWLKPQYRDEKAEALCGIILVLADIDDMEESHRAEALERNLQESWAKLQETEQRPSSRNKPHALLRTLAWTLRRPLAATVFPRLCAIGFKFAQPFLIGSLIRYLDDAAPENNNSSGHGLISAFALVYSGVAVSTGLYWYQAYRTITMVRGSLIAVVYARTLDLDLGAPSHASSSTLMSTDVERICTCIVNLHELWANVLEVGLAIYILATQLGGACIAVAFLALACGFGTLLLTKPIEKRQEAWLKAAQKRLRATEATLGSIKSIKMMGWTEPMQNVIQGLRIDELRQAMHYRKLQVLSIVVSLVMTVAGPATAITTFTVISVVRGAIALLPSKAFTSIAVLALISTPLITLFQALPLLKSAVASMTRIQDFLNQPCRKDSQQGKNATLFPQSLGSSTDMAIPMVDFETNRSASKQGPSRGDGKVDDPITMSEASMGWGDHGDKVVLHDISITIAHGALAMVIGPVGCGKSNLLKAMLGETRVCQGVINVLYEEVAFSDQTPWMMFGTIRDNITGMTGHAFDETWYRTVLHACALEKDLEQLPDGG
ncbi:ABC multidrug transporter [Grosmannia clavigera kw1407]|uniref:ABC multidrug transporter n=1 Tax=Grosmannia clavigera (strain kw1407 / UAMH 11150) TaxID=655863 RepID=F0XGH6_GROCL|nr:ABC multidrug transporter [Grosmannia clavigera kw1407]EFX03081.1 ABC multidrug transporter [Grosmannia clavigera kw1407]